MLANSSLIKFLIVMCSVISITIASEFRPGSLTLKQVIDASKIIADATPYKKIDKKLSGTIITINDKKYEIRYFSFDDARINLPKKMSFKKYAYKNNLYSLISSPIEGIYFETFDYRMANLRDGEFFSISLRIIE